MRHVARARPVLGTRPFIRPECRRSVRQIARQQSGDFAILRTRQCRTNGRFDCEMDGKLISFTCGDWPHLNPRTKLLDADIGPIVGVRRPRRPYG